jgi:hypothetical protein
MDTRDIIKATETTRRLVQDEEFYKHIFKKTEKIVSVVFYIAYNIETDNRTKGHLEDILGAGRAVHDSILKTLEMRAHTAEDAIRSSAHSLIALESKLRVAQVAGLITAEVMHVLSSEIDGVLRGMNKYLKQTSAFDDTDYSLTIGEESRTKKAKPKSLSAPKSESASSANNPLDRRERIKTVLEAKGEATIKDISEIITDCSEKTIQRELNAMIEDNIVKRQGERRWSKYSLF